MTNQELQTESIEHQAAEPQTKNLFTRGKAWFKRRISTHFKASVAELNTSQWIYFIAFVLLILTLNSSDNDVEEDSSLLWVGFIAGIGLMRELWHVFNRLWENMLGRGLIFVIYAATANIAIAVAALKVNEITGIEPTPFVFTIGFATLLMLPFWILVTSIIFFSISLLVGNFWLMISVFLRLIRVKVKVHWEDKSFVIITMIMRILLIPIVIGSVIHMAVPFAEQIQVFDNPLNEFRSKVNEIEQTNGGEQRQEIASMESGGMTVKFTMPGAPDFTAETDELLGAAAQTEGESNETLDESVKDLPVEPDEQIPQDVDDVIGDNSQSEEAIGEESEPQNQVVFMNKIIANFIFYFETYPHSKCEKQPHQRSLPIDENLLLLAEADDSPHGYKFTVVECVGKSSE